MAKITKIAFIIIINIIFTTAVLLTLFIILINTIYSINIAIKAAAIISFFLDKIDLFTRYLSLINI